MSETRIVWVNIVLFTYVANLDTFINVPLHCLPKGLSFDERIHFVCASVTIVIVGMNEYS